MSSGNKKLRKATSSSADAPLTRLNKLLADAVQVAKEVEPMREDGPAIKKAHKLANSLLKVLPIEVAVKSIEYNTHKASLDKAIKELKKDVSRNWKNGWDEHSEMEEEIGDEIVEWFPTLWQQMAVDGMDVKPVQQALVLCSSTVKSIENIRSRFDESPSLDNLR